MSDIVCDGADLNIHFTLLDFIGFLLKTKKMRLLDLRIFSVANF